MTTLPDFNQTKTVNNMTTTKVDPRIDYSSYADALAEGLEDARDGKIIMNPSICASYDREDNSISFEFGSGLVGDHFWIVGFDYGIEVPDAPPEELSNEDIAHVVKLAADEARSHGLGDSFYDALGYEMEAQ